MGEVKSYRRFLIGSKRCKLLLVVLLIALTAQIIYYVLRRKTMTFGIYDALWDKAKDPKLHGDRNNTETEGNGSRKGGFDVTESKVEKNDIGLLEAPLSAKDDLSQVRQLSNGDVVISKVLKKRLKKKLRAAVNNKKIILIWIPAWGGETPVRINSARCGYCEATYDREMINDENVGAVLIHFSKINATNMPQNRRKDQLYIFWSRESTASVKSVWKHSLQFEDSFKFNATMTYRRDSDFFEDYGTGAAPKILTKPPTPKDLLKIKTKLALAVVSDCRVTPTARVRYKTLKILVKMNFGLEAYGACFPGRKFPGGRDADSFTEEARKYKFYFAYENSYHCKDYITEKFFRNSLRALTVPVVWGARKKDYEDVAPPGSFIFAGDFSTLKKLAKYLKYLDRNNTAYLEYFRWLKLKPSDMPLYGREHGYCQICRALHGINIDDIYNSKFNGTNWKRPLFTNGTSQRSVDLVDWFYGEDNPECR